MKVKVTEYAEYAYFFTKGKVYDVIKIDGDGDIWVIDDEGDEFFLNPEECEFVGACQHVKGVDDYEL